MKKKYRSNTTSENNNEYPTSEFDGWICTEPSYKGYFLGCRCSGCIDALRANRRKFKYRDLERFNARRRAQLAARPIEARRAENLRSTFGLTLAQYNDRLAEQNGVCAICETDKWGGRWNSPCVDHDHGTGRIRGLLCLMCNRGIGNFKDSAELLRRTAEYVESTEDLRG